jgi:hypothetical protein
VAEENRDERGGVKGEDMQEIKQQDYNVNTNDAAKDGPIKAAEEADMVGDTTKDIMDGSWKAA